MRSRVAGGSKQMVTSLVCSLASTWVTPGSSPTSVLMVCTQCAQEILGMCRVRVVMGSGSGCGRGAAAAVGLAAALELGRGLKDVGNLAQHALALGQVLPADGGDDARVQVAFEQQPADLAQRGFHRLHLLDDINAIGVIFEHALDAFNMPRNAFHALEGFLLAVLHGC